VSNMQMKSAVTIVVVMILLFGCTSTDLPKNPNEALKDVNELVSGKTKETIKEKPEQPTNIQKVLIFAKPAIVFIKTDLEGDVTLPEAQLDAYGNLVPAATTYSEKYKVSYLGSGFTISNDGYIITNAHVVRTDEDVEQDLLTASAQQELAYSIQSFYNTYGEEPTNKEIGQLNELLTNYIEQYGKVKKSTRTVSVIIGANAPGVAVPPKQYIASIRKIGDSDLGGVDFAILKLDQTNMPAIKLGDSDKMQAAAQVYAVGYPGIVTSETGTGGVFSMETITEPTITSGVITSKKTTNKGITVLGIDASIKGGNSGGPSFNDKGEVIGVNTFGFSEEETYNYILPSNLLKDFIKEANVENTQGPVDEHYKKGLEYYWEGEYSKAKEELEIVKNLYPGHPYLQKDLTMVQEKLLKTE